MTALVAPASVRLTLTSNIRQWVLLTDVLAHSEDTHPRALRADRREPGPA